MAPPLSPSWALPKKGIPGIYLITNTLTRRVYVGSSVDTRRRLLTHAEHLKKGNHHCLNLQAEWDMYGESAFSFGLMEEVQIDQLGVREQLAIASFAGKLLNSQTRVGRPGILLEKRRFVMQTSRRLLAAPVQVDPADNSRWETSVKRWFVVYGVILLVACFAAVFGQSGMVAVSLAFIAAAHLGFLATRNPKRLKHKERGAEVKAELNELRAKLNLISYPG